MNQINKQVARARHRLMTAVFFGFLTWGIPVASGEGEMILTAFQLSSWEIGSTSLAPLTRTASYTMPALRQTQIPKCSKCS